MARKKSYSPAVASLVGGSKSCRSAGIHGLFAKILADVLRHGKVGVVLRQGGAVQADDVDLYFSSAGFGVQRAEGGAIILFDLSRKLAADAQVVECSY